MIPEDIIKTACKLKHKPEPHHWYFHKPMDIDLLGGDVAKEIICVVYPSQFGHWSLAFNKEGEIITQNQDLERFMEEQIKDVISLCLKDIEIDNISMESHYAKDIEDGIPR